MFGRSSPWLVWLVIGVFSLASNITSPAQLPQAQTPIELRENDPLSFAVIYARRSNNQFALSEIAIYYAELGKFQQVDYFTRGHIPKWVLEK